MGGKQLTRQTHEKEVNKRVLTVNLCTLMSLNTGFINMLQPHHAHSDGFSAAAERSRVSYCHSNTHSSAVMLMSC